MRVRVCVCACVRVRLRVCQGRRGYVRVCVLGTLFRNKSCLSVRWCGHWHTAERRNEEKAWTTVVGVVLGTLKLAGLRLILAVC